jgi:hypothetical protein
MIPKIDISAISVSRLKSDISFEKYHIDVSIDEIENNDLGIKLKYKFVLLSTPTNAKISIEGLTSLSGNETQIAKFLEPDQKNVPMIVNIVYQELLPLLYVLTKSIDIPCPAYKISQISQAQTSQAEESKPIQEEPKIETTQAPSEPVIEKPEEVQPVETPSEKSPSQEPDALDELEKLVEGQNVSSI